MASRRAPKKQSNRDLVAKDVRDRELPKKQIPLPFVAGSASSPEASDNGEEKMSPHIVRMKNSDWLGLKMHFKPQGLSVAAGIRQVLFRYMRDNGIKPISWDDEG